MDSVKPTKKSGKVLDTVVNVILVIAILLGITFSFTAFVSKKGSGVPSLFGIRPFAIQSNSMAPFFNQGDLVIDKAVKDPAELQEGDVITFWTVINGERVLNTHRIIEVDDYENYISFVTKGDNNTMEDGLTVHQSEVVGKYVTHISKLGYVIDFLQTSKGFFVVIVLPCALFFVYQLVSFFKVLFAYQAEKAKLEYKRELLAQQELQNNKEE